MRFSQIRTKLLFVGTIVLTLATCSTALWGQEVANSIGMKLRLVPKGEFLMGTSVREADKHFEEHLHRVEINRPFYMGKFEVTQGQWKAVMGTKPWKGNGREDDDYPATYVSWGDAVKFCKKLSAKEGVKYRLPTEAEWEYACRGKSQLAYSFGDDKRDLEQYAWYDQNAERVGRKFAQKVGQRLSNKFGLYDMHGNVREWCEDLYDDDFRGDDAEQLMGPGDDEHRVIRGGGWSSGAEGCRSAARAPAARVSRADELGFRVLHVPGK